MRLCDLVSAPASSNAPCHLRQACGFDSSALGGDLEGARAAAEGALREAGASPAAVASVASESSVLVLAASMAACRLHSDPDSESLKNFSQTLKPQRCKCPLAAAAHDMLEGKQVRPNAARAFTLCD